MKKKLRKLEKKSIAFISVCFIFVIFFNCAATAVPIFDNYEVCLLRANEFMAAGDYRSASVFFEISLGFEPSSRSASRGHIISSFETAQLGRALSYIGKFKGNIENDFEMSFFFGRVFFNQKLYSQAAAEFEKTLALKPEFAPARLALGICAVAAGDAKTFEANFGAIEKLRPGSIEADCARALRELGRCAYKDSLPLFKKIVARDAAFGPAYMGLAFCSAMSGDYKTSFEAFASFNETPFQQSYDPCDISLIMHEFFLERFERDLRKILSDVIERHEVHFGLASLMYAKKKYAEAADIFKTAAALKPDCYEYNLYCAEALKNSGDHDKAVIYYNKAAAIDGDSFEATSGLFICGMELCDSEMAAAALKIMNKLDSKKTSEILNSLLLRRTLE